VITPQVFEGKPLLLGWVGGTIDMLNFTFLIEFKIACKIAWSESFENYISESSVSYINDVVCSSSLQNAYLDEVEHVMDYLRQVLITTKRWIIDWVVTQTLGCYPVLLLTIF